MRFTTLTKKIFGITIAFMAITSVLYAVVPEVTYAQVPTSVGSQPEHDSVTCKANAGLMSTQNLNPICLFGGMVSTMAEWSFRFAGWFANTGAFFMDESIKFTVDTTNYQSPLVRDSFVIVRDLVNMSFIFILLYLAFLVILQVGVADVKRSIAMMVIVGLLLNFSVLITGFIIDIGNIFGLFFHDAMIGIIPETGVRVSISSTLTQNLKIPLLQANIGNGTVGLSSFQQATHFFMGAITLFVAGFTFISAGFIFFIRTVTLMLLIVFAPVAFAALILPKTKNFWSKWTGMLVGNTFVLPLYLLLLSIIMVLTSGDALYTAVSGSSANAAEQTFTGAFNADSRTAVQQNGGIILNFILLIIFLLGALKVSQQFAGGLANKTSAWAGKAIGVGTGLGLTAAARAGGGLGFAYRNSVGRAAEALSQKERFKKWGSEGFGQRQVLKATNYAAKASGDWRNVKGVNQTLSAVGKTVGKVTPGASVRVNTGSAKTGGARAIIKASEEKQYVREKEIAESMGYDKSKVDPLQEGIKRKKKQLKAMKRSGVSNDTVRQLRNEIEGDEEELEELKVERGLNYAKDSLQKRGRIHSWFGLRTTSRNTKLGKKLENELGKKLN